MLGNAVSRRISANDLVRVRNRLRREDNRPRLLVPVQDLLARAVLVHRPKVVVVDLTAVDVLPTHVSDLTVRENPRRVVLLDVAGKFAYRPVRQAFIERPDVRHPTADVTLGARRAEDDRIVRKPSRLVIVPTGRREVASVPERRRRHAEIGRVRRFDAFGKLERFVRLFAGEARKSRAVGVYNVKTVVFFFRREVRKEDALAVVMDLRVAEVPLRVLDNRARFLRNDVVSVDSAAGSQRERITANVVGVVTDVRVPVFVGSRFADGEDNFVRHSGVAEAFERLFEGRLRRFRIDRRGQFFGGRTAFEDGDFGRAPVQPALVTV